MGRRGFGELEAQVMSIIWGATAPLTSREIWLSFAEEVRPARTTLLTILSRLEDKELLVREPASGGAVFTPVREEAAHAATSMSELLDGVADRDAALVHFVGALSDEDVAALKKAFGGS